MECFCLQYEAVEVVWSASGEMDRACMHVRAVCTCAYACPPFLYVREIMPLSQLTFLDLVNLSVVFDHDSFLSSDVYQVHIIIL